MKYRLSQKSVRFFTKLLALLVMACVLVTSSSAVIALDAYHA